MNCRENRLRCSNVCSTVWGKYAKTNPARKPELALPVSSLTSRYVPKPDSVRAAKRQKLYAAASPRSNFTGMATT